MAQKEEREEEKLVNSVTSSIASAHEFLLRHDGVLSPRFSLELESHLSSAALSLRRLSLPIPPPQAHHPPFFHRLLSDPTSPLWAHHLRLSHPSFHRLLALLPPSLPPSSLAAALFRLAHSAPCPSLARRFALPSPSAAARAFFSASHAICHSLRLPSSPCRRPPLLPNCRGALGFLRFPVHNTPGILLQALVDADGTFLDVSAGWPGYLTPDAVLHQTNLYFTAEESSDLAGEEFVFGGSCLPLLPWLLTPYRISTDDDDEENQKRIVYNAAHKEAMRAAGAAFRGLTRRWRILDRAWKEECVEFLPFVVMTCCLLHNFAVECGEAALEEDGDWDEEEEEGFGVYEGDVSDIGERVRDSVAEHLARLCSER